MGPLGCTGRHTLGTRVSWHGGPTTPDLDPPPLGAHCRCLPSSSVLSRMGGWLGTPSPMRVKASTRISYSTYLPSPASWALRDAFPSASQNRARRSESFSLYMTCEEPCVSSPAG